MKRVELETTITNINDDHQEQPTAPSFTFINSGIWFALLNDNFLLYPNFSFKLDLLSVAAKLLEKGIVLEQKTTFKFTFPQFIPGVNIGNVQLIQTFIKPIK